MGPGPGPGGGGPKAAASASPAREREAAEAQPWPREPEPEPEEEEEEGALAAAARSGRVVATRGQSSLTSRGDPSARYGLGCGEGPGDREGAGRVRPAPHVERTGGREERPE